MTEKQKSTITQMRESGVAVKDIAAQLDLSPGTVKSYLSRSRQSEPMSLPAVTVRVCRQCGAAFDPARNTTQYFCSRHCYNVWWHAQDNRRATYSKTCKYCGRPFTIAGHKKQVFCSRACYLASRKAGGEDE
jgi:hypothetical protein